MSLERENFLLNFVKPLENLLPMVIQIYSINFPFQDHLYESTMIKVY